MHRRVVCHLSYAMVREPRKHKLLPSRRQSRCQGVLGEGFLGEGFLEEGDLAQASGHLGAQPGGRLRSADGLRDLHSFAFQSREVAGTSAYSTPAAPAGRVPPRPDHSASLGLPSPRTGTPARHSPGSCAFWTISRFSQREGLWEREEADD